MGLEEIKLNIELSEIRNMKKDDFVNLVKRKVEANVLKELEQMKMKHSKVKMIKHKVLKLQNYLKPNKMNIKKDHSELIFKLRCQVTNVKENMKREYDVHTCSACMEERE